MKSKTKFTIALSIVALTLVSLVFIYYSRTHISIWGLYIPKNELKNVSISTKENDYIITNPETVLELTKAMGKMKKLYKVDPVDVNPKEASTEYIKLMIQSKFTYGGSFWKGDNKGMMIDSNGYYWSASDEIIGIMDKSIKEAQHDIK
jgi:hypothetical protein